MLGHAIPSTEPNCCDRSNSFVSSHMPACAGLSVAVVFVCHRTLEQMRQPMKLRFIVYGLLGWCLEIVWTGFPKRRPIDWRLPAHTSWWMFPIYGLLAPLYEPVHNHLRTARRPWWQRGLLYAVGIMSIEVTTGWLIQRITGAIPWDYRNTTSWHWRGLTRFDYAPLWFGVGLGLEPVHDWLVRHTSTLPATQAQRHKR
jgi:hypothetical protein